MRFGPAFAEHGDVYAAERGVLSGVNGMRELRGVGARIGAPSFDRSVVDSRMSKGHRRVPPFGCRSCGGITSNGRK